MIVVVVWLVMAFASLTPGIRPHQHHSDAGTAAIDAVSSFVEFPTTTMEGVSGNLLSL